VTVRKAFDRDLWLANDRVAKEAVENLFSLPWNKKFEVVEHESHTAVDMELFVKGDVVANIETEIKRVWKGDTFQYPTVQFPERKRKFCELADPTVFIMWNFDLTSFIAVTSEDMLKSPCTEVPNKYVYKGELFFQVPLDKIHINDIKTPLKKLGLL